MPVQAYPCHGGANQRWSLDPGGVIRSDAGLCLGLQETGGRRQLVIVNMFSEVF